MMKQVSVEQIRASAERFQERVPPAHFKLAQERAIAGSPPSPARKRHLEEGFSEGRALEMAAQAEARGVRVDPRETLREIAEERIIGSNDLMSLNYLELAVAVSRSVCRIRIGGEAGTGVLIGPGVLMTNNHVIADEAEARQAQAQFDYQENRSGDLLPVQSFRAAPDRFFFTDRDLDFTLIGTAPLSGRGVGIESYPWVPLIGSLGKAENGDPLNIIQHPQGGLKQIALRNNTVIEIPDGKPDFLYYTTDTEPGSSGSPCFNDQWELVALHHQAVPRIEGGQILKKDGTPWREDRDDPALIDWIANEGTRVSALVAALQAGPLSAPEADLRDRFLSSKPPNPVELARRGLDKPPPPAPTNGASSSDGATFEVPLSITVSVGGSGAKRVDAGAGRSVARTGSTGLFEEKVEIDPDWHNRTGYDPNFLGVEIPLPGLSGEMRERTVVVPQEFRRDGDPHVLDYHHYSVAMNKDRCLAWYSAAIVDGDRRHTLPDRDDKWFIDPRIDDPENPETQCGEELYATANTDRGHLTRYLSVAWGDTKAEALRAANDTFHFTNCALQLQGFNRSRSRWQGIEQFLLEQKAKRELRRMVVITGPLFKNSDPFYQNEHMGYALPIPLEFWKVCALVREDGSLSATAFILGQQDVRRLPGFEEAFNVNEVQVTVQHLEDGTGIDFGVLKEHDHLAAGAAPGTLEVFGAEGRRFAVNPLRVADDAVVMEDIVV